MIIWLNGAFGVGKTAVAGELAALLPEARIVDPEQIGYVMRRTLWRGVDYQDIRLWRQLTAARVRGVGRRHTAIVPMTMTDRSILLEVSAGARVFLLTADRGTLAARIRGSSEAEGWRTAQLDRCLDAFAGGGFGEPIATDDATPAALARDILHRLARP